MSTPPKVEIDDLEKGLVGLDEEMSFQDSPTLTSNTQQSESKLTASCTPIKRPKPFQKWWQHLSNLTLREGMEYCEAGYPFTAAFLDSDENFMIYRRFGYLQARLLLNKQEELRVLEERLDMYDKIDETNNSIALKSREMDEVSEGPPRLELLKLIETRFREYAQLLCIAQQMVALSKPGSADYHSVKTWFSNEEPLVEDECYIQHKEDVITLKPGRENAWLDRFVETVLRKLNCRLILWIFRSKETRVKTSGQNVIYFTKNRIDCLVTLIITGMILALLIIPVYLLWNLSEEMQTHKNNAVTIGVLLSFTLIFSAVLSFFTKAQRHEILGAAAAYCAVLVVFIGNGANRSTNSLASFNLDI